MKFKELKEISKNISLLYVEDDDLLGSTTFEFLGKIFDEIDYAKDGLEGLELFKTKKYDIVVTDIDMPRMNGIEMLKRMKAIHCDCQIVITTAFSDSNYLLDAISLEVDNYFLKPLSFNTLIDGLYKIVYKMRLVEENENYKNNLLKLVDQEVENRHKLELENINNYEQTLQSLVDMIESRDRYTGGHSKRVAQYCEIIARAMGHTKRECDLIYRAGILHDIGKIVTPDAVLLKPSKLNDLERSLIEEHVSSGANLLKNIPMFEELSKIISSHHEHYDGNGYPNGLTNEQICPLSRIMIVADSFDAMTTSRIYKTPISIEDAFKELKRCSKTQFDPDVVNAAVDVLSYIKIDNRTSQEPLNKLEEQRFSYFYKDSITHLYNSSYLDLILMNNRKDSEYKCINIIYLHNFTAYNKKYGWENGDKFLENFAIYLESIFNEQLIFRVQGDDFAVLSKEHISLSEDQFKDCEILKNSLVRVSLEHHDIQKDDILNAQSLQYDLNIV